MLLSIGRRLLYSLPGLFGITVIIFLALRILPGDPLAILYGDGGRENLTPADIAEIKHQLGIDKALYLQYADWMKDVITGKMGVSFWRGDSVSEMILRRGAVDGGNSNNRRGRFVGDRAAHWHPGGYQTKRRRRLRFKILYDHLCKGRR